MEIIPPDDIAIYYGKLSEEQKSAVTNLTMAVSYISVTGREDGQVIMDWHAAQPMSIHLILGIIGTGRSEFGKLWLDELRNKISQIQ
jgi:hypothetical protein